MTRDITPFGLRMPATLKAQVEAAASSNGRSMNAEVVDRLQRSFGTVGIGIGDLPDGVLLDEVIARYGARLQLIISPEIACSAGLDATRTKAE